MQKQNNNHVLFLENVNKEYGEKIVLDNIDLAVSENEFCILVGHSGCGKSTLLRLILGQEKISSGRILMEGKEIFSPSPERGIVYQKYSLFPHLTVLENIMIGKQLPLPFWKGIFIKKAAQKEAMHYLESVHLAEHAEKYPYQLSGGMQQRVAIVQALIKNPKILLMDEPLGALDPGTREVMQVLILQLWKEHNMTIFFVTHDLEEAVFLGTRILVLSKYYTDGRRNDKELMRGARIVADYPLKKHKPSSTKVKESGEFGRFIQKIRYDGFDPEKLQHVTQFNLEHSDSFQTLTDDEKKICQGSDLRDRL